LTTASSRHNQNRPALDGVADLHIHSIYSDGTLTPAEIVQEAALAGLEAIAITDHDSVSGVKAAIQAGSEEGIEVIPGVELSTMHEGHEIHIIALFLDITHAPLLRTLRRVNADRRSRIREMSHKLADLRVEVDPDEILEIAGNASPGRVHVARALVRNGHAHDIPQAFRRFIGDDAPAYVPKSPPDSADAIRLIRDAHGIPIMAHPMRTRADEAIPLLARLGLMGIEVFCPLMSEADFNHYVRLARRNGLALSGGSDFHGFRRETDTLGRATLPAEHLEHLRRLAEEIR